ncbi:substrate-binding domain-containing protein [Pontivivens ytuae]|uniref:Substrate-binding domain-containing protein n=1 Tax=Pontivivens ytuae TaxID=2789856 RepID=A0A7S9QDG8_9RHOB|nr:substrate-binding domain-containing protein [Pontivivens ytuae]
MSRVLNGSDLVRDDVRTRVEAAMTELGYIPDVAAQSLATRRSRTLGAIIPTLKNAIFAEGVNALEEAARGRGYTLLIAISNYDPELETELIRRMIERGVDGLMLVGNHRAPAAQDLLKKTGLLHVCGWSFDPQPGTANVGFDNGAAMHPLVDHLVERGHREIAMLAANTQANDRARDRVAGVRARLVHHGLELRSDRLAEVAYSIRDARAALPRLLATKPTAVICGNDTIALGAILAAQSAGVRIPQDLAVTGFDNLTLSAEMSPALTTMHVPAVEMGELIAAALIDAVEGETPPPSHKLTPRLIVRETTMEPAL